MGARIIGSLIILGMFGYSLHGAQYGWAAIWLALFFVYAFIVSRMDD